MTAFKLLWLIRKWFWHIYIVVLRSQNRNINIASIHTFLSKHQILIGTPKYKIGVQKAIALLSKINLSPDFLLQSLLINFNEYVIKNHFFLLLIFLLKEALWSLLKLYDLVSSWLAAAFSWDNEYGEIEEEADDVDAKSVQDALDHVIIQYCYIVLSLIGHNKL